MKKLMNLTFYKTKGFYISIASIVSLFIALFTYVFGFNDTLLEYNNPLPLVLGIIGIVIFALLLVFKPTANYSPMALWAFNLISFLVYVSNIYMYFTGVFYNGVTIEALQLIEPIVMVSAIFFILSIIMSNVSMYIKHLKKEEEL